MAITYNNLYLDVRRALRLAGVEAAQLEARELLCHVTHKSREQFWLDLNYYVSSDQERQVRDLLRQRLEGTPVAYLLGEWSFCGLDLDVDPTVLIPRSDTEVLAELATERTEAAGERA
ncbi:MAG: peptide chain release factor N(5)-glutamine methyltransferase, partial [Candidatus Onthomonas sp.]